MTGYVGAPNSIARFITSHDWGKNRFVVAEYVKGEWVCLAAQTSLEGARNYHHGDTVLIEVETLRTFPVQSPSCTWLAYGSLFCGCPSCEAKASS